MDRSRRNNKGRRRFGSISRAPSGAWRIRYPHPDGSRRTKHFPTRELAKLALSKLEVEFARKGILGEASLTRMPFDQFAPIYLRSIKGRQSPNTVDEKTCRMRRVQRAFGGLPMHEIASKELVSLRNEMYADGLSHASVNRTLSLVSAMFTEAIQRGHALENPVRGIRREREPKRQFPYLELSEQGRIVEACADVRPILGLASALTLDTGLRASEMNGLKCRHASIDRAELTVYKTKNGKPRIVPVPSRSLAPLRERLGGMEADDFIFPWRSHRGTLWDLWTRAFENAGHPDLHWHDQRHLYAVNLLHAGTELPAVARLMGASLAVVVSTYADHAPNNYREQARLGLDRQHQAHSLVDPETTPRIHAKSSKSSVRPARKKSRSAEESR